MMDPKISVIIPVFNMEPYLERCLDSVLTNTYRYLEVICVDDGSTDRSLEILRRYEVVDPRVVVVAKENGGVSSARNAGLERVTGKYVSFVDPDDFVHPQYFELLICAVEANESAVAICGFRSVEDKDLPLQTESIAFDPRKVSLVNQTQFFQNHDYRSHCWGQLILANQLQGQRFREDLTYSEDSVFVAELWELNPELTCVVLAEPIYYYYQREDSLVKQAKIPGRYRVAEIFAQKALIGEKNDIIFLDQAVKRGLSTRYYATHIHPDKQIARKCTSLLNSCLPLLRRTSIYSWKRKAAYFAFICIPGLYWLYRSITEPDMWAWERVERRKRRKTRKDAETEGKETE